MKIIENYDSDYIKSIKLVGLKKTSAAIKEKMRIRLTVKGYCLHYQGNIQYPKPIIGIVLLKNSGQCLEDRISKEMGDCPELNAETVPAVAITSDVLINALLNREIDSDPIRMVAKLMGPSAKLICELFGKRIRFTLRIGTFRTEMAIPLKEVKDFLVPA